MPNRTEETALLRQRTGIRNHAEGIHLQAVIIQESQRLMPNHSWVQLKAGGLQAFPRPRVAGIQNRHVVLLCHIVDRSKQREIVLLRVNILFPVGREKDIFSFF